MPVITDELLKGIAARPQLWAPLNPTYVKTHKSAPGTVRSWFRQMRAADFERATAVASADTGEFFLVAHDLQPWSVLDTQRVVEHETKAHYESPWWDWPFVERASGAFGFFRNDPPAQKPALEEAWKTRPRWLPFRVPTFSPALWREAACEAQRQLDKPSILGTAVSPPMAPIFSSKVPTSSGALTMDVCERALHNARRTVDPDAIFRARFILVYDTQTREIVRARLYEVLPPGVYRVTRTPLYKGQPRHLWVSPYDERGLRARFWSVALWDHRRIAKAYRGDPATIPLR
jgi:hypothetical protein